MSTLAPPFDRQIVPGAYLDTLDLALVERTIRAASDLGRDPGLHDPVAYLERYYGLARDGDTLRPTVAGILAFAREPDRWLTCCGIDIAFSIRIKRCRRAHACANSAGLSFR